MIESALNLASRPAIALPLSLLAIYVVYQVFLKPSGLPDVPIIGAREGDWFPLLQAKIRNTLDVKAALNSSYTQYRNRPAILPLLDGGNCVMLPRSDTKFASEQPTNVLSMHAAAEANLLTDYTTMDPSLTHDPIHLDLVTGALTKEIGNLVPDIADEIEYCFNKHLGSDAAWREVCVYETLQRILSGVTNRVFVSLPLCRNEELLKTGVAFAQDIPFSSLLLKAFPSFIRPVVAPLVTLPNRIHTRKFESILAPEIKARLEKYDAREQDVDGPSKNSKHEHNDFLQWLITQSKEIGNPKNWQTGALAQRVLLLNFAAIHTSTFAITHALLDIASSPPELISELREEVQSVLQSHGNTWSKRGLAQMEKLDSAIRESQRKNSFVAIGIGRIVVAEEGVTFPSGVHVPKGLPIAVPGYSVHQDSEVYPEPKKYQPLRFYNARHNEADDYVKRARNAFPTATTDFLGWGLGRNACPGRFFASNEIKMMIAFILLHYDIDHLSERPRNTWIAQNRVPPMKATLRIRRITGASA